MKNLLSISICLFILVSLVFNYGCEKDEPSLSLPPVTSFKMNFDEFSSEKSTHDDQSTLNYSLALSKIQYWSAIAEALINIPEGSFLGALEESPIYNENSSTWEWTYVTTVGKDSYKSRLTGKIVDDSVQWKMYLSKFGSSDFINYLWFEGKSHQNQSGGWWMLNSPVVNGGQLSSSAALAITWTHSNDNDISLKYLYVAPTVYDETSRKFVPNSNIGGYIEYKKSSGTVLNCLYNIYSKTENSLYGILWNLNTYEGKITINSQPLGCWDEDFEDIDCE